MLTAFYKSAAIYFCLRVSEHIVCADVNCCLQKNCYFVQAIVVLALYSAGQFDIFEKMTLKCIKCSSSVNGIDKFICHLRFFHGIADRGQEVCCGQNGCPRTFTSFFALKCHLKRQHGSLDTDISFSENSITVSSAYFDSHEMDTDDMDSSDRHMHQLERLKEEIRMIVLSLMCSMSSKPNMTMSNVLCVVESIREVLEMIIGLLCLSLQEFCREKDVPCSTDNIDLICAHWKSIPSSLHDIGTKYKMEKALTEQGMLIKSQEIALGNREDRYNVLGTGSSLNMRKDDSMQYIPIGLLLHKLSKQKSFVSTDASFRQKEDGLIADFRDTITFKNNKLCQKYPDTFLIHLFVDAFETCNELGSHTGVHKLEAMYMCVKNVPSQHQAQLDNIFLVALWYAEDVKKYGYKEILKPIVEDLKSLESDCGVRVNGDVIHGVLVLFSADNLGAHSLFGFLESFSAKKFCSLCETVEGDDKYLEQEFMLRTPASYDAAVGRLQHMGYNSSETGIKGCCILNELSSFHVTTNYVLDAMHDLLEGIIPYELQCILPVFVKRGFFTENELQSLIVNFNYGPADQNSKPPFTVSTNIRLKAAEAWCLLRTLPMILGSRIPEGDEHWHVITMLCEITDIIFAPRYSEGVCHYLGYIIDEHHRAFKKLFSDKNLLPKHHFLIHYPRCMMLSGPPSQYWCMRFEARHNFFKEVARVSHCFKNICHSLAKRAQYALASALMRCKLFTSVTSIGPCTESTLCCLPEGACIAAKTIGLSASDKIHSCSWVTVGHYRIYLNTCVVYDMWAEYPQFGVVQNIFFKSQQAYLVIQTLVTLNFNEHFRAFEIEHTDKLLCCALADLKDHHPCIIHDILLSGKKPKKCKFVQTRYLVL